MKCKVKTGVFLREISGVYALLATEQSGCPRILPLNNTGAFYFSMMQQGLSVQEMAREAAQAYHVNEEKILPGLQAFVEMLAQQGYLEA